MYASVCVVCVCFRYEFQLGLVKRLLCMHIHNMCMRDEVGMGERWKGIRENVTDHLAI